MRSFPILMSEIMSLESKTWIRWLHLGELYYNTTYHISIGMPPFRALYGYESLNDVDYIFGESRTPKEKDWIQESQDILRALKDNLQTAQNQQKKYADKNKTEQIF